MNTDRDDITVTRLWWSAAPNTREGGDVRLPQALRAITYLDTNR
jgi:hypothetical protein